MYLAAAATGEVVTGVLTVLGSVFTFLVGTLTDLVTVLMAEPLLLIPIGISVAFVIVRFFRTIFRMA